MKKVEIRADVRGEKGVFATTRIDCGEKVLTIEGESVPGRGRHTIQVGPGQHIDPEAPARFVNHSCAPNCGIRPGYTLVAMREIMPGEPISFDYAMTEMVISSTFDCGCGADNCRGAVRGFAKMTAAWKTKNQNFVAGYLAEDKPER